MFGKNEMLQILDVASVPPLAVKRKREGGWERDTAGVKIWDKLCSEGKYFYAALEAATEGRRRLRRRRFNAYCLERWSGAGDNGPLQQQCM